MWPSTAGGGAGIVTDGGYCYWIFRTKLSLWKLESNAFLQFQSILENEIEFNESWEKNPGILAFHLLYVSRR